MRESERRAPGGGGINVSRERLYAQMASKTN